MIFSGKNNKLIGIFIFLAVGVLFFASSARAANMGDIVNFNVDKSFDVFGRNQVPATLIKMSDKLYFYVDKSWWDNQSPDQQTADLSSLDNLSLEFSNNIYPNLTTLLGGEWSPGIDKDSKITILLESMNSAEGGYFREMDEYEKLQFPSSNEREMLYLSTSSIGSSNAKVVLAHEFTHLITFNQKNKILGLEDDTWLNEGRADYSSTMLGYDVPFENSNLQQRVNDFIENPSDSVTDWAGSKYDYASVNLFIHYLVDHYGINVLSDSLRSKSIGVQSINDAFARLGARENFAQVFTNWTIALILNDCSQSNNYCYKNTSLTNLRVTPTLIFLPLSGSTSLSSTNVTKNWSGNWEKIIGGNGDLTLDFSGLAGLNFQVPYIVYDKTGNYYVKLITLDSNQKGQINIKDFGNNYKSMVLIPSLQSRVSGFDGSDLIYPYSFTVSITGAGSNMDQTLIQKLIDQISSLKAQIAKIQSSQGGVVVQPVQTACSQININLYFGSRGQEVSCLQQFLKNQGTSIYPEGFVTGNFGNLTKQAVIRFQSKYMISQTGFVGPITLAKINQILIGK